MNFTTLNYIGWSDFSAKLETFSLAIRWASFESSTVNVHIIMRQYIGAPTIVRIAFAWSLTNKQRSYILLPVLRRAVRLRTRAKRYLRLFCLFVYCLRIADEHTLKTSERYKLFLHRWNIVIQQVPFDVNNHHKKQPLFSLLEYFDKAK